MKYYSYLQSDFADPVVTGENSGFLSAHSLDFTRTILKVKGGRGQSDRLKIGIQIYFKVEGASGFKFEVTSKSFFGVIDTENIVLGDIYEMDLAALEVLRKLLNQMLGKDEVSRLDIKLPDLLGLPKEKIGEMLDFVQQLRSPELDFFI